MENQFCKLSCLCCSFHLCSVTCWMALATLCGCRNLIAQQLVFFPPAAPTYRLLESSSSLRAAPPQPQLQQPPEQEEPQKSIEIRSPRDLGQDEIGLRSPAAAVVEDGQAEEHKAAPPPSCPPSAPGERGGFAGPPEELGVVLLDPNGHELEELRPPQFLAQVIRIPGRLAHLRRAVRISTLLIRPGPERRSDVTILFSSGNACNLGIMARFLRQVAEHFGVNVLAYDYAGYSPALLPKQKPPGLYRLLQSGLGALRYLHSAHPEHCSRGVVVYGQSLGSVPSTWLASNPATRGLVKGLVLHSALTSGLDVLFRGGQGEEEVELPERGKVPAKPDDRQPPWFDILTNIKLVDKVQVPSLVIHGDEDAEIPLEHGSRLARGLGDRLWRLWVVKGGNHHNIESRFWPAWQKTLGEYLLALDLLDQAPDHPP